MNIKNKWHNYWCSKLAMNYITVKDIYHYYRFKYRKQLNDLFACHLLATAIGVFYGAIIIPVGTTTELLSSIIFHVLLANVLILIISIIFQGTQIIFKRVINYISNLVIAENKNL